MAKMQRIFLTGKDYWIEGKSEQGRWLRLFGRMKIGRTEYLIFKPVKKASKRHNPN